LAKASRTVPLNSQAIKTFTVIVHGFCSPFRAR
jgi:hypothetical protein